jgi:hypothetical protein
MYVDDEKALDEADQSRDGGTVQRVRGDDEVKPTNVGVQQTWWDFLDVINLDLERR